MPVSAAPDDRTGATNPKGGRIERAQAEAMLRSSRARPATTAGFELERISCMVTSFRVGCGPPEINIWMLQHNDPDVLAVGGAPAP